MADLQQSIARLQAACDNPRAQPDYYQSRGTKVVGCFAPWAPEELVHASGMIPMALPRAFRVMPKALGMEGPVISASKTPTL